MCIAPIVARHMLGKCIYVFSLVGNVMVNRFPRPRICSAIELLDASYSVRSIACEKKKKFVSLCILISLLGYVFGYDVPALRRIVGGVVFYAIRVVSKESSLFGCSQYFLLFIAKKQ
jgi:hypothetical protein